MAFLDTNILGFNSFYTFRNHFCVTAPVPGAPATALKIVGYKNIDELKDLIDPHTFRVERKDCIDLPPKIYKKEYIELTDEQTALYEKMKTDFKVKLSGEVVIEAPMAVTMLMKLQQILCGFLIDEEGMVHNIADNRTSRVVELVQECHGKVIVWARFRPQLAAIAAALRKAGVGFVEYHGGVGGDERQHNLQAFQTDPSVKVFLANAASGGTGLNLTCAATSIYASNDFNANTRWQSEDRIHRIGQKENALYIDMIAANTIDVKIVRALMMKKNVADSVLSVQEMLDGSL